MLIQCNFLDDVARGDLTSTGAGQEVDSSRKGPTDDEVWASRSILSGTRRCVWRCIRRGAAWYRPSSASLFQRSVFAMLGGATLCSLMGGISLWGLLYFGRVAPAEHSTASGITPRIQDVQAMHHERHGVIAMTGFLQQQVDQRQSVAHWWRLLAESTVLLHGIEWQGHDIEFTVSGHFAAINELMIKARSMKGVVNMVLREFRPDGATHHSGSITGVAQLKMTLCGVSQPSVLMSPIARSVAEGEKPSPSNEISPIPTTFSSHRDCAPVEALQLHEVFHREAGGEIPVNKASTNQRALFSEALLNE